MADHEDHKPMLSIARTLAGPRTPDHIGGKRHDCWRQASASAPAAVQQRSTATKATGGVRAVPHEPDDQREQPHQDPSPRVHTEVINGPFASCSSAVATAPGQHTSTQASTSHRPRMGTTGTPRRTVRPSLTSGGSLVRTQPRPPFSPATTSVGRQGRRDGDPAPPAKRLAADHSVTVGTADSARELLKTWGLVTAARGSRPVVVAPAPGLPMLPP